MDKLPITWKKVKLGNLVDLQTGYPFPSRKYLIDTHGTKLLRGDNIIPNGLRWANVKMWDSRLFQSTFGLNYTFR